jgi:predicted nucleic acid-binding protein
MSSYMLHTDIVTDLIHGKSPSLDRRIAATASQELCISAVTRGELLCALPQQTLQTKMLESKLEALRRTKTAGDKAESLRKTTHAVLAQLTPREAKALRIRFGIEVNGDHTLEGVHKQFDKVRERIRLGERDDGLAGLLDQFLTRVPCLPWDADAATQFARIALDLHVSGSPIGSLDTMIAAHALAVGAVLVTSNERHFSRVTGLKTENWTRR